MRAYVRVRPYPTSNVHPIDINIKFTSLTTLLQYLSKLILAQIPNVLRLGRETREMETLPCVL